MIITEQEYNEKLSIEQLKKWAEEYNKQNRGYFYIDGSFLRWGEDAGQRLNLTNDDYKHEYCISRYTFMTTDEYVSEVKAGNVKGVRCEVVNGEDFLIF